MCGLKLGRYRQSREENHSEKVFSFASEGYSDKGTCTHFIFPPILTQFAIQIPLPHVPPLVVALIPTNGKDTGSDIHALHMRLLAMAAQVGLKVVCCAADGASSELAAQVMMDNEESSLDPFKYENKMYGIELKATVFPATGPLVSNTDPPHARKTLRNQPQYGTHTGSLGSAALFNRQLVEMAGMEGSGLVNRDVVNPDKQDDGAARRFTHYLALTSLTQKENNDYSIKAGYEGLFVYLFIFGSCFFNRFCNTDFLLTITLIRANDRCLHESPHEDRG